MSRPNDRGQTETVGMVLLLGIVVVVATTFGVALYGSLSEDTTPLVTVEGTVNETSVRLVHAGGDPLDAATLEVVLRNASGTRVVVPFEDGSLEPSADGRFDPGDAWTWTNESFFSPPCSSVDVYLVHQESNAVVYAGTREVGDCSG